MIQETAFIALRTENTEDLTAGLRQNYPLPQRVLVLLEKPIFAPLFKGISFK